MTSLLTFFEKDTEDTVEQITNPSLWSAFDDQLKQNREAIFCGSLQGLGIKKIKTWPVLNVIKLFYVGNIDVGITPKILNFSQNH